MEHHACLLGEQLSTVPAPIAGCVDAECFEHLTPQRPERSSTAPRVRTSAVRAGGETGRLRGARPGMTTARRAVCARGRPPRGGASRRLILAACGCTSAGTRALLGPA